MSCHQKDAKLWRFSSIQISDTIYSIFMYKKNNLFYIYLFWQEDLRKRKEDEERHAREEEFLRSSLRGSKKLKALEKAKSDAAGQENTAFQLEETDCGPVVSSDICSNLMNDKPDGETPELTRTYGKSLLT